MKLWLKQRQSPLCPWPGCLFGLCMLFCHLCMLHVFWDRNEGCSVLKLDSVGCSLGTSLDYTCFGIWGCSNCLLSKYGCLVVAELALCCPTCWQGQQCPPKVLTPPSPSQPPQDQCVALHWRVSQWRTSLCGVFCTTTSRLLGCRDVSGNPKLLLLVGCKIPCLWLVETSVEGQRQHGEECAGCVCALPKLCSLGQIYAVGQHRRLQRP